MRKLIFTFLCGLLVCPNIQAQVFDPAKFEGGKGNGTEAAPYLISKQEHLTYLAETVNNYPGCSRGKYFKLTADIYLTGTNFQIGNSKTSSFEGIFDGAKFRIHSFLQAFDFGGDVGLFGYVSGATIRRLTIDGGKVEGGKIFSEQSEHGGVLIGYAQQQSIIDSCFIQGVDIFFPGHTGGLIGYALDTQITDCRYSGSVTGAGSSTGGLIGYAENVTITRCFSQGSVTGSNYTGGFIGKMEEKRVGNNTIEDCYSSCRTAGIGNVGGFIGYIFDIPTTITKCYATGSVSGQWDRIGGFIGSFSDAFSEITDCYATGSVVSTSGDVGGFIGYDDGLKITRCFASGSVKGKNSVGGFSGFSDSSISSCYAVGTVEGDQYAGGFIGYTSGSSLTECFAAGATISSGTSGTVGGFVGTAYNTTYKNCYFDKQTTGLSGASAINLPIPKTTSELTQSSLSGFSTNWDFATGYYYPQLKVFTGTDADANTRLRSNLSAVPLTLITDGSELSADVQTIIRLTDKTPEGKTITWIADPSENVTILNNAVYAKASGAWRTLTLRAGNIERTVKFRSTKGLLAAEILGVKINGEPKTFNKVDTLTHLIECGEKDELVFAEIELAPYAKFAKSSPGSPVKLYANELQKIIVETDNGKQETYYFLAEKDLPVEIFVRRWDDVLAINNNFATNGGYTFTAYEWYKDGKPMPNETKGYIRLNGEKAEYKVKLEGRHILTPEDITINTCPINVSNTLTKAAVYPNPVQRGQMVRVETSPTPALPEREGEAQSRATSPLWGGRGAALFDTMGNIVSKQTLHDPVSEIAMPDMPGQYFLQITENGVSQTFKIVVE